LYKAYYSYRPFGNTEHLLSWIAAGHYRTPVDTFLPAEAKEAYFLTPGSQEEIKNNTTRVAAFFRNLVKSLGLKKEPRQNG
jgi:hypothetical protein